MHGTREDRAGKCYKKTESTGIRNISRRDPGIFD